MPHQLRPQRIALHIARHRHEMLITLHGKRLEAPLIDRPGSSRVMVGVPALGMGDRDPAQHFGQLAIVPWPEQQMSMIGHQAIRDDP